MKRRIDRSTAAAAGLAVLLCLSLGANAAQYTQQSVLRTRMANEYRREMSSVAGAMADIEVNLKKLLIASGAELSAGLLGETALLALHVENGIARLPLSADASTGAMKFAGQIGDYALALSRQITSGGMLSTQDERQIEAMLSACQGLNKHLTSVGERLYTEPMTDMPLYADTDGSWQAEAIGGETDYPSLIYDGPFSDARKDDTPKGLTGRRVTREQAREAAARYAGVQMDRVRDAADSGGVFEAFGFTADTQGNRVSVQVTGQGGHLLWMMPEQAAHEQRVSQEECLIAAQRYLEDMGFGEMERCFVQMYDGLVVANFAAVLDGVLLYPDQVKLQISMQTGRVVGAECSQYLMNHAPRERLVPAITQEKAVLRVSDRLDVQDVRLCVIPMGAEERLCWECRGEFGEETYYAYVDAVNGEMKKILRVVRTPQGEAAM